MKKLIYVLIFSFCLIINLDNAFAKETSENSIITNGSKIDVSCKVNSSYSIKVDGGSPKYIYSRDSHGSMISSFQTLNLTEAVSINDINFKSFKYVYINNFKFLIDPLLLNSFKEGDCLDVAINNAAPEELKEDGKNTIIVYASDNSSGSGFTNSSSAKCVYDSGTVGFYTFDIQNNVIRFSHKEPTNPQMKFSYTHNLTITDFTKNGKLYCPNKIYVETAKQGELVLGTTGNIEYALNRELSYVKNVETDEKVLLNCSYAGNYIIKTDKDVYFQFKNESEYTINNTIDKNSIGDSCPLAIYMSCAKRTGKCNVGLDSSAGNTIFKLDVNTPVGKSMEELLGGLKNPISLISNDVLNYELSLNGQTTTLNNIEYNNSICTMDQCETNKFKYTENALREIFSYCDTVYESSKNLKNDTKVADCVAVTKFYNRLVEEGLISDYAEGCSFITTGLKEKLDWVLDLLKIAGPILALGLGTLDFIKAVASGDADKEMKTAFKRFSTRIIAAILLFLIPFILSFIMDIFLENQEGYNSDDPFCNLVKWEEKK